MSWLLFYILVALYPVAVFIIWKICDTWRWRLLLWGVMALAAIWYCLPYYQIKNEHTKMCAAMGGLKVLIQPEKVDRVRLTGQISGISAQSILGKHYPQVKVVEALTEKRGPDGRLLGYYEAYTATANPKVGQQQKGQVEEGKFIYATQKVEKLDPDTYEIGKLESEIPHGTKTETSLSKDGKVYAKHTALVHWWTGIQYPDALPTWRCPDTNRKSPPNGDINAPKERWAYPPFSGEYITDLIFK
jgi:hypothetical protein